MSSSESAHLGPLDTARKGLLDKVEDILFKITKEPEDELNEKLQDLLIQYASRIKAERISEHYCRETLREAREAVEKALANENVTLEMYSYAHGVVADEPDSLPAILLGQRVGEQTEITSKYAFYAQAFRELETLHDAYCALKSQQQQQQQ
ncbi:MAG: hypothetical protein EBR02_02900 [Alphaproteobacteria bacterium]|nr:hypothetical protein [Alphaproteobacteria bacterium]